MSALKKLKLTGAMLLILLLGCTGSAMAADWWYPTNIGNLGTFMAGVGAKEITGTATFSGSYYVTPLAYQSYLTDQFRDSGSNVLFTNHNLGTSAGPGPELGMTKYADLTTGSFRTTGLYNSPYGGSYNVDFTTALTNTCRVHIYELTKDWTFQNLTMSAGTLIIGMNDDGVMNRCTDDFDDFILAASKTAPTPLPGAVWLLGSGLVGLMGYRKNRQKA
ncbi:MAG: hypothetical protein KKA55_07215 [Proteobacteria bacterium]|nr:hypothetical protein [Pseudomonadota bacterium]MBU1595309.1 hypothetical protein [Pseudomonadota bacterium]